MKMKMKKKKKKKYCSRVRAFFIERACVRHVWCRTLQALKRITF
jgi:hypothetical protein